MRFEAVEIDLKEEKKAVCKESDHPMCNPNGILRVKYIDNKIKPGP